MRAVVGLMGLGVMGSNLALNIESHGFPIAVWNRSPGDLDLFLKNEAAGRRIAGEHDVAAFAGALERPRKIIILVKAGEAVDSTIERVKPYLDAGDILIDGGNSHFSDTRRREEALRRDNLQFIGCGVSGGAEGARLGPSLMPGGPREAYEHMRAIFEAIAAKVDDGPCVTHVGLDGAGHFVKMVHNGIEYGDMQLIAEAYDVMRRALGMEAAEIAGVFEDWNDGPLNSFLVEITAKILRVTDPETGRPLVDVVLDKAGQKGTGKWTSELAGELGVPIPTIDAALAARLLSALKEERAAAQAVLPGPTAGARTADRRNVVAALRDALYGSKVCSYAQGFALIAAGSRRFQWGIAMSEVARIWKGGCIIRAGLLENVKVAFTHEPQLKNLLIAPTFVQPVAEAQSGWRQIVASAGALGIPVPAISASLAYFDSYRTADLPQNLTQAQRDYFGSHMYERKDRPGAGPVHTDWSKL